MPLPFRSVSAVLEPMLIMSLPSPVSRVVGDAVAIIGNNTSIMSLPFPVSMMAP